MNAHLKRKDVWLWIGLVAVLSLGAAYSFVYAARQDDPLSDSPYLRIDPEKIVVSDRDSRIPCGECHTLEYDVWTDTPHATGFDEMHRSERAQEILKKMDFRLSKRESLCLRCHYTAGLKDGQARAIAGVSCESCHGAARDWLNVHNDYGGADHDSESEAHKQQRIAQSIAGGMLRPSDNLYAVAANCFECHTVPEEKLVNVGGHASGSAFDLLDWSEDIRHNFLQAQWSEDETNRERTAERKRLMFVVGRMLNYEYSIRAAAKATEPGAYAKAMERRVKVARRDLDKLYRAAPIPAVQAILARGRDLRIVPGNGAALRAAADAMSQTAQQFTRANDGTALAALDPVIAGEPIASDDPPDDPAGGDPASGDDPGSDPTAGGDPAGGEGDPAGGDPGAGNTSDPTAGAGSAEDPNRVAVTGQKRRKPAWFSSSKYETLGPSAGCSCHNDQFDWWNRDAHSGSAAPLLQHDPRAVQIAQTYGLSVNEMKLGNQICMNCHGTIVTGDEAFEVFDGVSCESCHGPGSEYERKHQPPKPAPADFSAYAKGASLGMVNQENPATRAANCARCHHITDERLLSAGHPTGDGFNLADRSQSIRHWEAPILAGGALNTAYAQAAGRRPIPQVTPATPAVVASVPPPSSGGGVRRSSGTRNAPRVRPPRIRPVGRGPGGGTLSTPLDLPPLPAITDSTSTEEILLLVKMRLERIYQALGRGQ